MDINKANIANALHSVAKEHIVATADEIYDNGREQYQSEVNETVGRYVENPEFVCVYTDAEGRILWGIKANADIFYGAGVPTQLKEYVEKKIEELSLDEYEGIVAFLDGFIGSDTTLKAILESLSITIEKKVDKEEGKSLIDEEYANGIHYIENPEFVEVKLDSEDRILEAIMADGTKLLPAGVKTPSIDLDGATVSTISNPEFIAVWITSDDRILFGLQRDGNFLFGCGIPSQVIAYVQSLIGTTDEKIAALEQYMKETYGEMIDNPEWLKVLTDAEDKVLEGTKIDGSKEINGDTTINGNTTLNGSLNHQGVITEVTDNPEYIEAKVDANGKFLEGFNKKGEKIFGVIPPQIKQYIDENMPISGSGVQSIEYDDATGDMYATYDDESGVTDVSMEPNGDIIVEYETGV